jgi:hypothetical protein
MMDATTGLGGRAGPGNHDADFAEAGETPLTGKSSSQDPRARFSASTHSCQTT